ELPINQKELEFVRAYTDKTNNETYSNGTRSYMKVYGVTDENVAGVSANRLLRKDKIKIQIDNLKEETQLNIGRHLRTLDRKLDGLASKGEINKEELQAIRLLSEVSGDLAARNQNNVQINFGAGYTGDITAAVVGHARKLAIFPLMNLIQKLKEILDEKCEDWEQRDPEGCKRILNRAVECNEEKATTEQIS
ncbi:MAG: hypothetical protein Q7U60_06540, partial [Candidatus Methanoperedens sp.]|nr:hypothetical protein [Candidatus Methanoperedens sp.]